MADLSMTRTRRAPGLPRWVAVALLCVAAHYAARAQPASSAAAAGLEQAFSKVRSWLAQPVERSRRRLFADGLVLEARRYEQPRPLRVWIARLDLTRARPRLAVTEPLEASRRVGRWEVPAATTLQFARQRGVQIAINAAAFWPFRKQMGEPMDVVGLLVVRGQQVSPPDPRFAAIHIDVRGGIRLAGPPQRADGYRYVVPGFRMVLIDGRPAAWLAPPANGKVSLHPRTGIGLDAAGRTLWIVVADGRQPGISVGLSQIELAALFSLLGARDAMNLDGGGSSTLVIEHADGTHRVVNTPVGRGPPGTLRLIGANLGFYLPGAGPPPQPPASLREALVQAVGGSQAQTPGGVLRYDGRTFELAGRDRRRVRLLGTFICAMHTLAARRWDNELPPRYIAGWGADGLARFVEAFFEDRPPVATQATRPAAPRAAALLAGVKLATLYRDVWFAQRGDLIWVERADGGWDVAMFWARTTDDDGRVRVWRWPAAASDVTQPVGGEPFARWRKLGVGPIAWDADHPPRCVIASWR